MNLELTPGQAEAIAGMLRGCLPELSHEIADTDNAAYRSQLVARRSSLVARRSSLVGRSWWRCKLPDPRWPGRCAGCDGGQRSGAGTSQRIVTFDPAPIIRQRCTLGDGMALCCVASLKEG
jgi:hypothetical protein